MAVKISPIIWKIHNDAAGLAIAILKNSQNKKKQMKSTMNSFGATERINHDSTPFYSRKICKEVEIDDAEFENDIGKYKDAVLCKDSASLNFPDSSVHLMVTSPPYNVGKDYDKDMDMNEYMSLLDGVFAETYRVLVNGGRACINIANIGRKPYIPYHSFIIDLMLKKRLSNARRNNMG